MNEELQNAVTQLITKTLEGVDTSIDFLGDELPDYIYQLMLWYGVYNFIWFCLSICFLGAFIYFLKTALNGNWGDKDRIQFNNVPCAVLSMISFLISIIGVNLVWLKIWIAPKVWLIEYAGSLVK